MKAVAAPSHVTGSCWVGMLGLDDIGEGDEGQAVDVVGIEGTIAACILIFQMGGRWKETGGGCIEGGVL